MNIKEALDKIERNLSKLKFASEFVTTQLSDLKHTAKNLVPLKEAINELSDIDFVEPQINVLKSSALFKNYKDEDAFTSAENGKIIRTVDELRIGLTFLLKYYNSAIKGGENVIEIKLPETNSFDELSKVSNDLKKAIEFPILDSNTDGKVEILTAENGSIWIIISVGTLAAVNLVASICWAAAVIRKKMAEAKMFEAHAKTLDLKNEALSALVSAQKTQLQNIVQAEAESIALKHYDIRDPETIGRLKLSLETTADLIDRGSKILPNSKDEVIKNAFPDYNKLSLIESSIKQIASSN
jgi:hypothetical protein